MSRGPTRRACLALGLGALATPAVGGTARPMRIACLEWTASETLLALGSMPIAAGDVPDYPNWVAAPPMPHGVIDLGSRFEPNRELLYRLKPDLVIAMKGYGVDADSFAGIAPVHEMSPFSEGMAPLEHARHEASRLAERIGRAEAAEALWRETDRILEGATAALAPFASRPVVAVSIFEERSVRIYGGGLLGDVLARVGLRNAWKEDIGPWGFAYVGLERLAGIEPETRVLMLDPMPEPIRIRLEASSLWRNLPIVRNGDVVRIPPVWPFGGLAAAGRFASVMTEVMTDA